MESFDLDALLELVLREGAGGMVWMIVGGAVGFVISMVGIVLFAVVARGMRWPSASGLGTWCRRGVIVFCLLTLPAAFIGAGVIWGGMTALRKVVNSEVFADSLARKKLNEPIARLYVQVDAALKGASLDTGEQQALIAGYLSGERSIPIGELEAGIAGFGAKMAEGLEQSRAQFLGGEEASGVSDAVSGWILDWVMSSQVEKLTSDAKLVTDDLREKDADGDGAVTVGEISASVATLHLRPTINEQIDQYRKVVIPLVVGPALLMVVVPVLVLHLLFLGRRGGGNTQGPIYQNT